MKNNAEESLLINCLNTYYGIAVTRLTFLPLGADREAATYQAETREGQSYFVKLKQGHHSDIGVALLGLLQASGVPSIIPPVKTRQGNLLQDIDDFTLIVYPFIEGKNGFSYPLKKDQWIALGNDVQTEMNRVSQFLSGRINELAERYATPLPTIEQEVESYKLKVENHLRRMGFDWESVTSKCEGVVS